MKILYFSRDYTTHDRRFLLKLAQSEHEVWFLRLENDGIPYEQRPLPAGIHTLNWPGGQCQAKMPERWIRLLPALEQVIESVKPDLVHAGPIQSCGFMVAVIGFHPFLVMSWGSDVLVDADRDDFWRWISRYTLERSDVLLCDCQAVRAKVKQIASYTDDQIVLFPWGIDLRQFYPGPDSLRLREIHGWQDCFVILSTRAWEPLYGIDILIEAFRKAYASNPKLRLVLLGTGSLAQEIRGKIAQYGLNKVIYCPGQMLHSMLPDIFRAADLYVSTAYSDGTSISLLEAMATELPVVVTDTPGNREWVSPRRNGWLVPAGNAEALADVLLEAARLRITARQQMGTVNRHIVEERANWDHNFLKLLEAYERLKEQYTR